MKKLVAHLKSISNINNRSGFPPSNCNAIGEANRLQADIARISKAGWEHYFFTITNSHLLYKINSLFGGFKPLIYRYFGCCFCVLFVKLFIY